MGYVVTRERVTDWDSWKSQFDEQEAIRLRHDARGYTIYRGIDDPTKIIVIREFSRHASAREFIADPEADVAAEGERSIDLVEPVDERRY